VLLRTGDAAWGETIDSRLEFTALDGAGTSYVDELEPYSFTRPSEQDCAAIAAPAAGVSAAGLPALPAVDAPADDDAPVPAAGGALTDGTDGAPDVAVTPVAAARPVATSSPTGPALVARGALLATCCGVAGVGLRRRSARRGSGVPGSA
jgi:hypothetical protein